MYRACMSAIHNAHMESHKLRVVVTVAGLISDKRIYREVLSLYYIITREAERKLAQLANDGNYGNDAICRKIMALDHSFTQAYEKDLKYLYEDVSSDWRGKVDALYASNDAAKAYVKHIENMRSGEEAAGAILALWGALVMGGGAAASPRIKSAFGEGATHLFADVTGPQAGKRRTAFVDCWDSLAEPGSASFDEIASQSQACMQHNNRVLASVERYPWWLSWIVAGGVAAASVSAFMLRRSLVGQAGKS